MRFLLTALLLGAVLGSPPTALAEHPFTHASPHKTLRDPGPDAPAIPLGVPPAARSLVEDDVRWSAAFASAGPDGQVNTFVEYQGQLIAGGGFSSAGGLFVNHIAVWDGESWNRMGDGFNDWVTALVVHQGVLFAGGDFTASGNVPLSRLAAWNGVGWEDIGGGVSGTASGVGFPYVTGLAVHQNELYVSGQFTTAGETPAANVARWDGTEFHAVGTGFNAPAFTLNSFNGILYAGGIFGSAGKVATLGVAQLDGHIWMPVGEGFDRAVLKLETHHDALHAVGQFTLSGETPLAHVARLENDAWQSVGSGLDDIVWDLASDGDALLAGGFFDWGVARFQAGVWQAEAGGTEGRVFTLFSREDEIYAGGVIRVAGTTRVENVARLTSDTWVGVPEGGSQAPDGPVWDARVWNGDLYITGDFFRVGRLSAVGIARFDGTQWHSVGSGLYGSGRALGEYRGELIVTGGFTRAGDSFAWNIASWDGETWKPLGAGLNLSGKTMTQFNQDLIVGGWFFQDGTGRAMSRIAAWNGVVWRPLGEGVFSATGDYAVHAVQVYRDRLYVGGWFDEAGGKPIRHLAEWTGTGFEPVATVDGLVSAMTVYRDELVIGGGFTFVDERNRMNGAARYDGESWRTVGTTAPGILRFAEMDGDLVAVGRFTRLGEHRLNHVGRWNPERDIWLPFGSGVGSNSFRADVGAVAVYGQDLFVGGTITRAGGKPSRFLAQWNNDPTPVTLLSFTASREAGAAIVSWSTRDRDALFQLERDSADGYRAVLDQPVTGSLTYRIQDDDAPSGVTRYRLAATDRRGQVSVHGPVVLGAAPLPALTLAAHPNPFHGTTRLRLTGPAGIPTRIRVLDVRGREVARPFEGRLTGHSMEVRWNDRMERGGALAAGTYFLTLESEGRETVVQKLVRLP